MGSRRHAQQLVNIPRASGYPAMSLGSGGGLGDWVKCRVMKKHFYYLFLLTLVMAWSSCYYDNREDLHQYYTDVTCDTTAVTYSNDVVGVLNQYCISCHNANISEANVNLDGYDNAKLHATQGSLLGSIMHQAPYAPMPSAGQRIPQCDEDKIAAWVNAGMPNN